MSVPQRLTFITLGARSVKALREFYKALGWSEVSGSSDDYASFDMGGVRLALYPVERLREEAAPAALLPGNGWNGITLAINVDSRSRVDAVYADALERGAMAAAHPTEREWGGYSAYIGDPEGNRWEIAWAPGVEATP